MMLEVLLGRLVYRVMIGAVRHGHVVWTPIISSSHLGQWSGISGSDRYLSLVTIATIKEIMTEGGDYGGGGVC